ncbi:MAG TPA: PQQ-binding-like beta-propeller repeat protein [Anaerolineales bacterium]
MLGLTLILSVILGLVIGFGAVRNDPPGSARWLTLVSTVGLAMPSFYIGSLFVMGSVFYLLWRGPGTDPLLPLDGFGWDAHLVFPTLALMARPTVQVAQVTAGLLSGELNKQYWEFAEETGFQGGPTLGPQGDGFYIASAGGALLALNLEGEVQWQTEIPSGGVGQPALGSAGEIYVSDDQAGLVAISAEGRQLWYFKSEAGSRSVAGPVVASDGRIFYTVTTGSKGFIQAVSPQGHEMWVTQAQTASFFEAPRLSADERFVFLKNDVFDAQTGELLKFESDLNVVRYFPGQDGQNYLVAGQNVIQWQLDGNNIENVDIAQWDSSHLSEVAAPQEVGVRPDKTAWLLYTSPGGITSLAWVSLDDQLVGSTAYRVSRGQVVAMREDLTTYICGGRSFDEEYVECAALNPQVHDEIWGLKLGNHGPVQGGFWKDGVLYIATRNGGIFAIDERPSSNQAASSEESNAAQNSKSGTPGLLWTYDLGEQISVNPRTGLFYSHDPELSEDLRLYIISEDDHLFAINSQGQLLYETILPVGFLQPDPGRDEYSPPFILEDGTVIIVGQEDLVYALNPRGDLAWEQRLEANPYRWNQDAGEVFITDTHSGLYTFNSQGMKWKFKSDGGQRSASGAVKGPNGNLYYTVTPSSKGVVQAVTSGGEALWATEVKTGSFYHTPQVSADGNLVFLRDDVIDAQTGNLITMNVPVQVDEYIVGDDGNLYLRSGHTVIRWQYGRNGFEILNTISWNHSQFSGQPFSAWVNGQGLVGMSYRGAQVWVNSDGEVIIVIRYPSSGSTRQNVNLETELVTECDWQASRILKCSAFKFGSSQTVWEVEIKDVPKLDFWNSIWTGEVLYVLAENTLYKYYIGNPVNGE